MKKKIVCILSFVLMLALCVVTLAACGENEGPKGDPATHYYDDEAKVTKSVNGSETLPLTIAFNDSKKTASVSGVSESDTTTVAVPKLVAKTKGGEAYTVTEIDAFAFADGKITNLTLPDSVTYIGNYAFKGSAITEIKLGNGITEIGSYAFQNCASLAQITITEKVATIGGNAFQNCKALKSVTFETSLIKEIQGSTFDSCTALEAIEIPASVETLGSNVFRKCTALKTVTLHEGLKTLGNSLFSGCTALEKLDLPFGLEKMGNFVFADCTSLTRINLDDEKSRFLEIRRDSTDWNSAGHELEVRCLDGLQTFVGTELQ